MTKSNALRRLEIILEKAIKNGDKEKPSGPILLEAMGAGTESYKIVDFFTIPSKVLEEVRSLKSRKGESHKRYIKILEDLNSLLTTKHIWTYPWKDFYAYIENKNVLAVVGLLADDFYSENPLPLLDNSFLERLNNEFSSLLNEVLSSDLSKELKNF